jgi:hypothetical protein
MADPSIIVAVIGDVADQARAGIAALTPAATAVAGSLTVLSILALGLTVMAGGAGYMAPIVRTCLLCAGTTWALAVWPTFTGDVVAGSHAAVGLIAGGAYGGPADLFQLAEDTAARMVAEGAGASLLSPSSIVTAFFQTIAAVIVWLGLSVVALMAALAEVELWLGASLCPLILPFLALGATTGIGWGALNFMLHGSVTVVALGAISVFMSRAVTAAVHMPGTDIVLAAHQSLELMGLALLTAILGMVGYLLAGKLVGGSPLIHVSTVRDVVGVGRSAGSSLAAGVATGGAPASAARGGGPGSRGAAGGSGPRPPGPTSGGGIVRSGGNGGVFRQTG